jgi:hypothetical protein
MISGRKRRKKIINEFFAKMSFFLIPRFVEEKVQRANVADRNPILRSFMIKK